MPHRFRRRPSASMIVALLALAIALEGPALADGAKAVAAKASAAINGSRVKARSIPANRIKLNALTGREINEAKLGTVPRAKLATTAARATVADKASAADRAATADRATTADRAGSADKATVADELAGETLIPLRRVQATDGPNENDATAAAPEIPLATAGALTVYGKCARDTSDGRVYAKVFIKTAQNGALFDGDYDDASGSPGFLNADTPEGDRRLHYDSTGPDSASIYGVHTTEWHAIDPQGVTSIGRVGIAMKSGTLAAGDGIYGPGNVCLFSGEARAIA